MGGCSVGLLGNERRGRGRALSRGGDGRRLLREEGRRAMGTGGLDSRADARGESRHRDGSIQAAWSASGSGRISMNAQATDSIATRVPRARRR